MWWGPDNQREGSSGKLDVRPFSQEFACDIPPQTLLCLSFDVLTLSSAIATPGRLTGMVGVEFTHAINASHPPDSYAAANLPPGLSIDTATGIISGKPTGAGATIATIYAMNATSAEQRQITFSITSALVPLAGIEGQPGSGDGAAGTALFSSPRAAAADAGGNLYIADTGNNGIRKIVPDGSVTTLAAGFSSPSAIVIDAAGKNLCVADTAGSGIRRIDIVTGSASALALTGTPPLATPHGLAIDAAGNLYVADTGNNSIRKIDTATGAMSTLTDTSAGLDMPMGLALNAGASQLYIADTGNSTIRVLTLETGAIETLAGSARDTGNIDGDAATARFNTPEALVMDATSGIIYVADTGNNAIRIIDTRARAVSSVAGIANNNGAGAQPSLDAPSGITLGPDGDIYVIDTKNQIIRILQSSPRITTAPAPRTIIEGATATFNAAASGAPIPTYQWYKDGIIIPGQTHATLTISAATQADDGDYSVLAGNRIGAIESAPARLTVGSAPPPNLGGDNNSGDNNNSGGGGAASPWGLLSLALLVLFRKRHGRTPSF
jgi:DNA-binding beta-propeller fold protein YncE